MTIVAQIRQDEELPHETATGSRLRGSWYEIDLGAIRDNYRQLRAALPERVRIFACLKRNGYGCGAGEVAYALSQEGVDGFAVASLPDAIAIRNRRVETPILLYPGAQIGAAPLIASLGLTISISSIAELDLWRSRMPLTRAFLKVDLGFFRAGASPNEVGNLLAAAMAASNVQIEGLYAHMSELPTSTPADAMDQFRRMQAILRDVDGRGFSPPIVMMSSSDGVLNHPEMDFDAVDPGALLVGLREARIPIRQIGLRPALKAIVSHLVAVKTVDPSLGPPPPGLGFREGMRLGVIGFGWGDGFPRRVPAKACALVGGKRVPILPPAHLEHLRLDLSEALGARFGDPVVLLGRQGHEEITLEELAAHWETDAVGIYGSLRDHVPRFYI